MPALSKQQLDSAQEFATAAIATMRTPEGLHPGTVIAATARMAGTFLFRSFRLPLPPLPPGQPVLSENANTTLPSLVDATARLLARIGISLEGFRGDAPVAPKDQPTLGFLETQRVLDPAFRPIQVRFGFDDEQTAYALTAATALLIRHCAKALDPQVGFAIAIYSYVEGAKTVPLPLPHSDDGC
jgi:hypothetical protein